jgi:hypothetical protein
MEEDIKGAINEYINQDLFNLLTTSDLQATCEARAVYILKKHDLSFGMRDINKIMEISDLILTGIYEHQEATP